MEKSLETTYGRLMVTKISLFLRVFLLGSLMFLVPLETISQPKCKKSFQSFAQTDIFNFLAEKKIAEKETLPSHSIKRNRRLTKEDLVKEKRAVIQYIISSDGDSLTNSLLKYPQLKDLRWTGQEYPEFFKRFDRTKYSWSPKGWGLLQIAAYLKNPNLLALFLDVGVSIRTRKKQGGVSIEDNALHISIRQNFKQGVDIILNYQKLERFGETRSRFIDEKSYDKKTPWFLSIRRDLQYKNTLFTNLIGQHNPSGYVQSYIIGRGARNGFEVAYSTNDNQFITLARRYLQISEKYEEYQVLKQNFGKNTTAPSLR